MRVLGGKDKGVRIKFFKNLKVRPTPSKIKEALFNILPIDSKIKFLDLFAGSGAVGLEALSRGAEKVVFIEKDWRNISIIKENLIKIKKSALLIKGDVLKILKKVSGEEFNIIFSDPPYQTKIMEKLFSLILNYKLLAKDGWLVLEHYHKEEPIKNLDFRLAFARKYGQTMLSFYVRR